MSVEEIAWLEPRWGATRVQVRSMLRTGGVSRGAYRSLNLAAHVGDQPDCVAENRRRLASAVALPAEPLWLEQVHGSDVVVNDAAGSTPRVDAAVAFEPGRVCVVMTADCLPVVIRDRQGTCVAVAHAGWRGLAAGVLEQTVLALRCPPAELLAWLGPAISSRAFEVGLEVREAFVARSRDFAVCFEPNAGGRLQADLYALARIALGLAGVGEVHGGGWCTYGEPDRFFSFRRDRDTGRMATLAWLASAAC
ncbi:MAG TPA: peptidoglycan editing factor PgeF [Steroidobacteraceae bacterium]|nr:peptidoglycan editing factor PgeF [Steroidobacteraceae bacterium]